MVQRPYLFLVGQSSKSVEQTWKEEETPQNNFNKETPWTMPNPKCLKVGDLVRFLSLPAEWSQKGFSVSHDDVAFLKKMIKRSWPSRVFMIDEYGDPWISAKVRERGKYYYHTWKIAESTGWRQVKRKKVLPKQRNG